MTVVVDLVVAVGMLVVVPVGLRLIGGDAVLAWVGRWWLVGAAPAVVSLWLPRGAVAAGLAVPYAVMTLILGWRAVVRIARPGAGLVDLAVATALGTPAVAAFSLVAERWGYHLFGFKLGVLALTVAHFHFAGFAAALIAGLVGRASGNRLVALTVPAGTALVFVGYFTGEYVELAGAVVLTAGMWLVGWLTWRSVRTGDRATRVLLLVSVSVLAVTMMLALWWALGEATGVPHPTLAWMAATHGLANALCFGLCGVLAWRRLRPAPL